MNRSKKVTEATWEVDPSGQWASKTESNNGSGRTILYRSDPAGTLATWWDTRTVTTHRFEANQGFEMAKVQTEVIAEPFAAILAEARAAAADASANSGNSSDGDSSRRRLLGY